MVGHWQPALPPSLRHFLCCHLSSPSFRIQHRTVSNSDSGCVCVTRAAGEAGTASCTHSAGLWGQGFTLFRSASQGTESQDHASDVATVGPSVHGTLLPKVTIPTADLMVQRVCPVPKDSSRLLPYKSHAERFRVSHHTGPEIKVAEEYSPGPDTDKVNSWEQSVLQPSQVPALQPVNSTWRGPTSRGPSGSIRASHTAHTHTPPTPSPPRPPPHFHSARWVV